MDELTTQNEELRQQLDAANALLEEKTNSLALKESQITDLTEQLQQSNLNTNEVLQQRLTATIYSLEETVNLLNLKQDRINHLTNVLIQKDKYCDELIKKQEQLISVNYTLLTRQTSAPEIVP